MGEKSLDKPHVHHIATGGTLDSIWDPPSDTSIPLKSSIVPKYLKETARYYGEVTHETLFLKDSRKVDRAHREKITNEVIESGAQRVLCTTGTFLMPDIGKSIASHPSEDLFKKLNRKAVLTGALKPITGYTLSDGPFNLGMSMAIFEHDFDYTTLIVMNGSCFPAEHVTKDLTTAKFNFDAGPDLLPFDTFFLIPLGGTIDFECDGLDSFRPRQSSIIPDYLRDHVRINRDFSSTTPFIKDSRDLSNEDLRTIAELVSSVSQNNVLITMGMYRMWDVYDYLTTTCKEVLKEKRVVITASRIPLSITDYSDAGFNIGYSLGKIEFMNPGVYVSICGKVLDQGEDIFRLSYTEDELVKLEEQKVI